MQNSKTVAQTLLGETANFGFCPPKSIFFFWGGGGARGVPEYFFLIGILIFLLLRSPWKIPLKPMGVLAPVSAHAGHSAQPPIDTSGNFPARVSAESISPNFPIFRSK